MADITQATAKHPPASFSQLRWSQCQTQQQNNNEQDINEESSAVSSLRKHVYSNILKTLQPKKENFQIKNSNTFHIPAQNIDCEYSLEPPRQGDSNEYPQSMFLLAK